MCPRRFVMKEKGRNKELWLKGKKVKKKTSFIFYDALVNALRCLFFIVSSPPVPFSLYVFLWRREEEEDKRKRKENSFCSLFSPSCSSPAAPILQDDDGK